MTDQLEQTAALGAVVLPTQYRPSAPRAPRVLVPRPRLVDRVEEGAGKGMVVVSGPAGSGKTTVLAAWAEQRRPSPAWLSVEREDAEPGQFWSRVLDALQTSPGVPAASSLAGLRPPPRMDRRFVAQLLVACEELAEPIVLVLDDLDQLSDTPALASLADVTRRGLGRLHLVLSTRAEAILPLQRLRLDGRLTELDATDLAFDRTEAVGLLSQHDLQLRPDQLDTLLASTEGWAVGLRLAALSLHAREDVTDALADLSGDHRRVADYFVEEVLDHLSPDLYEFLLRTCLPRRICADLAHTLTGRDDAQQLLAQLERENLFVVALDDRRCWYRYHHLFGDLLRHRLATDTASEQEHLHRVAATWFARNGEPIESARHLADAGAWKELARFVIRAAGAKILGIERHALADLIHRLPADLVLGDPEVAAAAAVGAYAGYDAPAVHAHVARARALLDDLDPHDKALTVAVLVTLEAIAAWIDGDAESEIRNATEALGKLSAFTTAEVPALPAYQSGTTIVLGMGKLWTGRLDEAETVLTSTLRAVTKAQAMTPVLAVHLHGYLAVLRTFQGALREADRETRTTLAVAEESGWLYMPQSAMAFLAEALITLMRGQDESCAVSIERGRACLGDLDDRFTETGLGLARARLDLASGNVPAALGSVRALRDRPDGWRMPEFLERWCELIELEAALAGDDTEARVAALTRLQGGWGRERPEAHRAVLVARAELVDGRPTRSLELLGTVTGYPGADLVPTTEAWLLTALAHDRLRNDADASAALLRALTLAEPEGIARPFLLSAERVTPLLVRHQQISGRYEEFTTHLLELLGAREPGTTGAHLLEPLTNRERSVLLLLPTMMSNAEIAEELFVSVNTVKVHLKSLYRKVGATSRRQAVARARELGLLTAVGSDDPGTITHNG